MWVLSCCTGKASQKVGSTRATPSVSLADLSAPVVHTLVKLWQPISHGQLQPQGYIARSLFKMTTLDTVDINNLINIAVRIRKTETSCLEIGSLLLDSKAVSDIAEKIDLTPLFPDNVVDMKVRKMMIATHGYQSQHPFDLTDPPQNRVGTVEVILNSAFTGGELQISSGDHYTHVCAGPYGWVAVHAEATCSIHPVTSGARVSLIFDIIACVESGGPTPLFTGGKYKHVYKAIVSNMCDCDIDVSRVIGIAEQVRPELVGMHFLTIDTCVLNGGTLAELGNRVDLRSLFETKQVVVYAKYLVIERTAGISNTIDSGMRGEGYLGTLVMTLASTASTHYVHFSRGAETTKHLVSSQHWYAFTADTTITLDPVLRGARVDLHYDIYTAKPFVAAHDPLPDYNSGIETPSFLTRSVVPETVRDQVQSVLQAELANVEAVIITLQHLFPEGPTDSLWNTYPAYLQGGDRVLYDILTGTNTSELYSVKLVEVTVRCAYDNHLMKDVIVPEQCTFVPITDPTDPLVKPLKNSGPGNVKLIAATKLTDRHRARSFKLTRVYQVFGLYVSKST